MKVIAQNKKAFFDYEILDKIEAGIVLKGEEVKALREGKVSLIGAFATVHGGELYMINCKISPYSKAYSKKDEEASTRRRKLLLHKKQLNRLIGDISRKGITLIPLRMYFNERNLAKVEIGVGKHKKAIGKKETIKERDITRQTRRELKGVVKY
jgi:SsrA-binding protein